MHHAPFPSPTCWGTLQPFLEAGTVIGRVSANGGWLAAFLQADPFDSYHFFLPLPEDCKIYRDVYARHFGHLPAHAKISVYPWMELPRMLASQVYHVFHLADPMACFTPLQRLRNRYAVAPFPITCLTHSLSYKDYPARFAQHVWGGTLAGDAVFCTSRAAGDAVRRMYAATGAEGTFLTSKAMEHPALVAHEVAEEPASVAPETPYLPLGVDPTAFHDPEAKATHGIRLRTRARLKVRDDQLLLLVFARLSHTGKLDFLPLLRALQRLSNMGLGGDTLVLLAAGKQQSGDPLPELLSQLAAAQGVEFRLALDPGDEERADIYAAADIFVSPVDNLQETFGLTLLEAAVSGLPVVASDFDGYRDLVLHGQSGFLIPTWQPFSRNSAPGCSSGCGEAALDSLLWLLPSDLGHLCLAQQTAVSVPHLADAIATLAGDADLRVSMGRAGRKRVLADLTYERMVEQCLYRWEESRRRCPKKMPPAVRTLCHPVEPEYGTFFSGWPSALPDTLCCRTEYGDALFRQQTPLRVYHGLEILLDNERMHLLLFLARKPQPLSQLHAAFAARLAQSEKVTAALTESEATFCIFWALKNDYLCFEQGDTDGCQ